MGQHDKRRASVCSSTPSEEGDDENCLEPFVHQVGGHGSILYLDESTICKPYSTRERQFYETLPSVLKTFTAEFKGVIEVSLCEDSCGYITLNACAPKRKNREVAGGQIATSRDLTGGDSSKSTTTVARKRRHNRIKLHRSGSLELIHSGPSEEMFVDDTINNATSVFYQNPWSIQCQTRFIAKMRRKYGDKHQFLLLENLTSRFRLPCVLDLKMGTQQHGADASEAKQKSQILKCQRSTSAVIGVRLGGMQVYHKKLAMFKCTNKYYGRSLTVDGFKEEIRKFWNNGDSYRMELLPTCLSKLENLKELIEKCEGCRFFASSLLIVYDGKDNLDEPPFVELRMIDFEHSTTRTFRGDPPFDGPDRGYITGLNCLINIIRDLLNSLANKNDEKIHQLKNSSTET